MITMTEIAKLTHVSQPTVSRVLNGSTTVAPEIRERVLACAKEHDYQFNALAKGLQGSKTQLLGVLLTDISNSFFADLAKQIEAEARTLGYSIILFNSDYDARREQEYLDVVRRYRVDGVLAVPVLRNNDAWPDCVKKLDVPVVVVTRRVEGLDSIYLDHEAASRKVAAHLVEQGFQRFLFIGRDYDAKYLGFQQELTTQGLADRTKNVEYWNDQRLEEDLRAYFQQPGPRTGIFANNDICALRVLSILRILDIPVPEQAGVIGFDDTFMARYLHPALSSVSQPIGRMAKEAVGRLTQRINAVEALPPLTLPLPASITVRKST